MNLTRLLAVAIVFLGVGYGVYQIASDSGNVAQVNSPTSTENESASVGDIGSEVK